MTTVRMTRRTALTMAAAGAALAASSARSVQAAMPTPTRPDTRDAEPALDLIAPLQPGSSIGAWKVKAVTAVRAGALTVSLVDSAGRAFAVDLCARDDMPGAPVSPARTARFDLFVANGGDGAMPTREEHGLAAMALAEVVRTNEQRMAIPGVMTQRARVKRYGDQIVAGT